MISKSTAFRTGFAILMLGLAVYISSKITERITGQVL